MSRYSRQKEILMRNLAARKDHPTAEELYESLREEEISLPTIYRNLAAMAQEGAVLRIKTDGGVDRFDANTLDHAHFACRRCNALYDIEPDFALDLSEYVCADGVVEGQRLVLYGICNQCLANEPKQ